MRLAIALLDATEVQAWQALLAGQSWVDGRSSAGWLAREVKHNLQAPVADELRERLRKRICSHDVVRSATRPAAGSLPLFNAYRDGMHYGSHTDDVWISGVRTDLAYTLFLSEPVDYDGGELVIEEDAGESSFKLPAGSLLLYDCGLLHRVEPVTRGTRHAAVGWIQSQIQDSALRQDLFDLDQVRQRLRGDPARSGELLLLSQVYGRLLRRHGRQ